MESFEKLNSEVAKWAKESAALLKRNVATMSNSSKHDYLKYKKTLSQSITSKTNKDFGVVSRISFPFNKYGYFFAVGASRGHKAKSNPRTKQEWYNQVFSQRFDKLADIVAENYADAVINSMMMDKKELK